MIRLFEVSYLHSVFACLSACTGEGWLVGFQPHSLLTEYSCLVALVYELISVYRQEFFSAYITSYMIVSSFVPSFNSVCRFSARCFFNGTVSSGSPSMYNRLANSKHDDYEHRTWLHASFPPKITNHNDYEHRTRVLPLSP